MKNLAKKLSYALTSKVKNFFGIKISKYYENFYILLPAFHRLPQYQDMHMKYDRFLPHMAGKMNSNNSVIDVGANCGDTLAGMVASNSKLQYVCIEPDSQFYDELNSNIKLIKNKYKDLNVITVMSLVGKDIKSASLSGNFGTKNAVIGNGGIPSKTLDNIVSEINIKPIGLLKSDVDGFDYDVLDSAKKIIETQKPIVFFECQNDYEYQKNGFINTIKWLHNEGYKKWIIFDNFGEVVFKTKECDHIFQLLDYVWKQNIKQTTRTIYYYDILACAAKDEKFIDSVMDDY
jgi:FkbM family methyltransferase